MDHTMPTETTKLQREVIRLREIIASHEAARKMRLAEEEAAAQPAAPAVDAAKLPPLPEFFALGKTRINGEEHGHFDAKQMLDYARAAIAAAQALPVDAADLGKLKALAEAATQGEWTYFPKPKYKEHHVSVPLEGRGFKLALFSDGCRTERPEQDAKFIAAANPAAILRIAALVAQQAARIAELEATADFIHPVDHPSRTCPHCRRNAGQMHSPYCQDGEDAQQGSEPDATKEGK